MIIRWTNDSFYTMLPLPLGMQKLHYGKEMNGPANKIFLHSFAIVMPVDCTPLQRSIISYMDSLWMSEYQNHIPVINHYHVDSARRVKTNLIYLSENIEKIQSAIVTKAGITISKSNILIENERINTDALSFLFFNNDTYTNNNELYIGTGENDIPMEMLNGLLLRGGWFDFEIWSNGVAVFQDAYKN